MPVCSRCGVDQPEDAFSEESQPLCEYCYEIELEEEAAGGAIEGTDQQQYDDDEEVAGNGKDDNDEREQRQDEEDIENQVEPPKKVIPLSGAARLLDAKQELRQETTTAAPPDMRQLADLVHAIEERGYSHGFGLDSRDALTFRLQRVLFEEENHVITWLTRPVVQALLEGPMSQAWQLRVAPLNMQNVMEGQSLLHWLVQWKLLQLQCGWRGHDDLVDLLLQAGAPVDATLRNGCTPLFFAVKYGSVDTVRLLLNAGANPLHRDCHKQTCLRNALPQASPYILQLLLQQPGVNPHETFLVTDDKTQKKTKKLKHSKQNKIRINALDIMVTEFVTPQPDVSWATLGLPSIDDFCASMLLFLEQGVQLSPHYPDVTFFLGQYLQGVTQATKRLYYTRKIADFFFGQYLPDVIHEQMTLKEASRTQKQQQAKFSCSLCSIAIKSESKQRVTLWCGHTLCQDCLAEYLTTTKIHNERDGDSTHQPDGMRPRCPACHNLLCLDVLPPNHQSFTTTTHAKKRVGRDERRRQALSRLSVEQLQFECEARNLVVAEKERKDHCVESLVHDWQNFVLPAGSGDDDDDDDDDSGGTRLMAELSLSHTMVSADNYLWVAASRGSVMIPITVKGIPIFALLSTTAPYTVVSPRFVKTFGFEINDNLHVTVSKPLKFVRAEDDDEKRESHEDKPINNREGPPRRKTPRPMAAPQVHLKALKDFSFTLAGKKQQPSSDVEDPIHVSLPSAMQAYEPQSEGWPVGVILGLDFFHSAAWTQMSVEVDLEVCLGRTVALLTNGLGYGGEFDLIEPRRADYIEQDFRYYSRQNGKMFWSPLWHVSLSSHDVCLSLGQYLKELLPLPGKRSNRHDADVPQYVTECAWCTRQFPFVPKSKQRDLVDWLMANQLDSGMVQCTLCGDDKPTFYCDEDCRKQAQTIHSKQYHGGIDLSKVYEEEKERASSATSLRWKLFMLAASLLIAAGARLVLPSSGDVAVESDPFDYPPETLSQGDDGAVRSEPLADAELQIGNQGDELNTIAPELPNRGDDL